MMVEPAGTLSGGGLPGANSNSPARQIDIEQIQGYFLAQYMLLREAKDLCGDGYVPASQIQVELQDDCHDDFLEAVFRFHTADVGKFSLDMSHMTETQTLHPCHAEIKRRKWTSVWQLYY